MYTWVYSPPENNADGVVDACACGTCKPLPAVCALPESYNMTIIEFETMYDTYEAQKAFPDLPKECFCISPARCGFDAGKSKTCQTSETMVTLNATNEDGQECISKELVNYRYCKGGCLTEMFGSINNDGTSGVLPLGAKMCSCCRGTSVAEDVPFLCGTGEEQTEVIFEVENMIAGNCTCEACGVGNRPRKQFTEGGIGLDKDAPTFEQILANGGGDDYGGGDDAGGGGVFNFAGGDNDGYDSGDDDGVAFSFGGGEDDGDDSGDDDGGAVSFGGGGGDGGSFGGGFGGFGK